MSRNSRSVSPKPRVYSSASASAFGKNTLVGVCSMMVRLMGLSSTSLALWVARHMTPFSLRQVLGPSLAKLSKAGSREQPPELVHPAHQPPAIEQLAHQVEEIQRDRRAGQLVARGTP